MCMSKHVQGKVSLEHEFCQLPWSPRQQCLPGEDHRPPARKQLRPNLGEERDASRDMDAPSRSKTAYNRKDRNSMEAFAMLGSSAIRPENKHGSTGENALHGLCFSHPAAGKPLDRDTKLSPHTTVESGSLRRFSVLEYEGQPPARGLTSMHVVLGQG
ncbi:hypothetical protein K469DRAFT_690034 [Zopfia rhizophila CBS 207.26]|uniref:Uncharacterized protein n=1 Tax=Zopfia rhizophila CBS 207.26 TaxID=1314779 RepID=A0A6A6DYX5_9PEZI|nr:hypothetical protein K469DRAFT_690034 [Zopfia rhizophila CBS 207.26]